MTLSNWRGLSLFSPQQNRHAVAPQKWAVPFGRGRKCGFGIGVLKNVYLKMQGP